MSDHTYKITINYYSADSGLYLWRRSVSLDTYDGAVRVANEALGVEEYWYACPRPYKINPDPTCHVYHFPEEQSPVRALRTTPCNIMITYKGKLVPWRNI